MAESRPHLVVIACALGLLSSSCSQAHAPRKSSEANVTQREFSPAEKEAASALSIIGRPASEDESDDPFERTLRCHVALVELRKGLGEGNVLGKAQLAALTQAEQFFQRQVQEQGAASGRQPAQLETATLQATEERGSMADEARIALACVRQFQQ